MNDVTFLLHAIWIDPDDTAMGRLAADAVRLFFVCPESIAFEFVHRWTERARAIRAIRLEHQNRSLGFHNRSNGNEPGETTSSGGCHD